MSRMFIDYLTADIYKNNNTDYSNGGLSSRHNEVIIFNPNLSIPYIIEIIKQDNLDIDKCVQAVHRPRLSYVHLEPIYTKVDVDSIYKDEIVYINVWSMYGGCKVDSSDSRFKEYVYGVKYAVNLHDRVEEYTRTISENKTEDKI